MVARSSLGSSLGVPPASLASSPPPRGSRPAGQSARCTPSNPNQAFSPRSSPIYPLYLDTPKYCNKMKK